MSAYTPYTPSCPVASMVLCLSLVLTFPQSPRKESMRRCHLGGYLIELRWDQRRSSGDLSLQWYGRRALPKERMMLTLQTFLVLWHRVPIARRRRRSAHSNGFDHNVYYRQTHLSQSHRHLRRSSVRAATRIKPRGTIMN